MALVNDYESYDALGLAELVAHGEVTPAELLEEAMARVEELNPRLNMVHMKMYDEARATLEAELPHGPLHGVPFVVKDIGTRYKGVPTTSACELFRDFVPDADSDLIRRYKAAGLVIFGKTTTPEFGLTTSTESRMYGTTRNPWNPEYTSGGSSGGASAAVASGILPVADGSDGGGSIRIPASCCGLVGLKVSRGRIPVGPETGERWSGLGVSGVLTRSVRDCASFLDLSSGFVPGDPYCAPHQEGSFRWEAGCDPGPLRIAFHSKPYNGMESHADCVAAVEDAAKLCEELGHKVEESVLSIDREALGRAVRIIVSANTRWVLDDRLEELGRELTEEDVEPITHALYETGGRYTAVDYVSALKTIHATGRQVATFFERYDLVLSPTMAAPPVKVEGVLRLNHPDTQAFNEALSLSVGFTQLFNATGNPAISVPLFWNESGLPIGVQFAAPYGGEAALLRLAAQLQRARPWFDKRPAPQAILHSPS